MGGKNFSDNMRLCLFTFFVLGNYFACFGMPLAQKAKFLAEHGNEEEACALARRARAWALWGLIPSTAINVALILAVAVFMRAMLKKSGAL